MKRIAALVLLALVLALLQASTGFASAPAEPSSGPAPIKVTHTTTTRTQPWALDPAVCKAISAPITGSGQGKTEIITQTFADGTVTVIANDLVTGSATDSTGAKYRFQYTNHSTDTLPGGSSVHQISMVDSFILNGNGSAKLNVGFNWRWTYTDSYWPPVDNWQKLSTRGDPLTCDPI